MSEVVSSRSAILYDNLTRKFYGLYPPYLLKFNTLRFGGKGRFAFQAFRLLSVFNQDENTFYVTIFCFVGRDNVVGMATH